MEHGGNLTMAATTQGQAEGRVKVRDNGSDISPDRSMQCEYRHPRTVAITQE